MSTKDDLSEVNSLSQGFFITIAGDIIYFSYSFLTLPSICSGTRALCLLGKSSCHR